MMNCTRKWCCTSSNWMEANNCKKWHIFLSWYNSIIFFKIKVLRKKLKVDLIMSRLLVREVWIVSLCLYNCEGIAIIIIILMINVVYIIFQLMWWTSKRCYLLRLSFKWYSYLGLHLKILLLSDESEWANGIFWVLYITSEK